jgi:hypothetical protein
MSSEIFLNSWYRFPASERDAYGKYKTVAEDAFIYTTKDVESGETSLHVIEKPMIDFYISRTERSYHYLSVPASDCSKKTVRYKDRNIHLSESLGLKDEYFQSFKKGGRDGNRQFMANVRRNPQLYLADVDIEDYYKTLFMKEHGAQYGKINKSFMDIEVDISNYEGFPDEAKAPCPINLISHIDVKSMTIYSFILIQEFNRDQIMEVLAKPKDFIREFVDEEIAQKFDIVFFAYESELDVVKGWITTVHDTKPDFCGIWNMHFDALTILNRLRKAGFNTKELAEFFCHPDIPKTAKYLKYSEDVERNERMFINAKGEEEKEDSDRHPSRYWDWFEFPGYTQVYDQMSLFSNLRKRDLLPSYSLNNIGESFAGVKKLNLAAKGYSLQDVNVKSFKTFLAYNIQDVYVQYCIENVQEDLDKYLVFSDNTRLSKGVSVSVVIKNMLMMYAMNHGEVIGNSIRYNIHEALPGAIVANPALIDTLGVPIMGKPSYVFQNVIDLDLKSEYPSVMICFNICKNAVFGRILDVQKEDGSWLGTGAELNTMLVTQDSTLFELSERFLGLPGPAKVFKEIERELMRGKPPG